MTRIALALLCVLILVGATLTVVMYTTEEEQSVMELCLEEGATETFFFEAHSLLPGEECEYAIKLTGERTENYILYFDFRETEEGALKNFLRAKICINGMLVYDELLATLFESDTLCLPIDFTSGETQELQIVYYLPVETDNGAKNTAAIFELQLTAAAQ